MYIILNLILDLNLIFFLDLNIICSKLFSKTTAYVYKISSKEMFKEKKSHLPKNILRYKIESYVNADHLIYWAVG